MTPPAFSGEVPGSWFVIERVGDAAELTSPIGHTDGSPAQRTAVICWPTSGALVLGSSQPVADFDEGRCAAASLAVVRRRSGGGAVLVKPASQVWIDFFVPRNDPLFIQDVLQSFGFIGALWASALRATRSVTGQGPIAIAPAVKAEQSVWSRLLCFGALGASEVTLGGRKVVGMSQRRDRSGAWFHSMALLELNASELAGLLTDADLRERAAEWLTSFAAAVPGGKAVGADLVAAVVAQLT